MSVKLKQITTKPAIEPQILIEDLVDNYPFSVRYLMQNGIRCIMCGEPIWGTLEEAANEKGFGEPDIERFVSEMKALHTDSLKD